MTWFDFIPVLLAFAVTAVLSPLIIPALHRMKVGQTERKEGVKAHLKKAGTPTMGGIMILAGLLVVALVYTRDYPNIAPVLILTFGFGVIGFLDDFLKVVLHRSDGLLPWQKLLLQFLVTGWFFFYLISYTDVTLKIRVPFTQGMMLDIGFWAVPLMFIVVLATVNGVNFTDGVDGLASGVTVAVAGFFFVADAVLERGLSPFIGAVIGALLAFLLFNANPAKVFMGDTGSLALGGFVAATAYMLNMPLYILIVGLIYAVELVSVVMQVTYFKATHGKRIFKMTPIHHHFELSGWSETRIVTTFSVITVILGVIALYGIL